MDNEYRENRERMSTMRADRIDEKWLAELTIKHCLGKKKDKGYRMSEYLGEIVDIIIDKTMSGQEFRGYTNDWKTEMRGKAREHVVKYVHNFNIGLIKNNNFSVVFNYYMTIVIRAFRQSLKQQRTYVERNSLLNDQIGVDKNEADGDRCAFDLDAAFPNEDNLDYGRPL